MCKDSLKMPACSKCDLHLRLLMSAAAGGWDIEWADERKSDKYLRCHVESRNVVPEEWDEFLRVEVGKNCLHFWKNASPQTYWVMLYAVNREVLKDWCYVYM